MQAFYNLRTGAKFAIGFGTCVLILLITGAVALQQMGKVAQKARDLAERQLITAIAFGELDANLQRMRTRERRHMQTVYNRADLPAAEQAVEKDRRSVEESIQKLEASQLDAEARQLLDQFKAAWQEYLPLHQRLLQLNREGKAAEATRLMDGEMRTLVRTRMDPAVDRFRQYVQQHAQEAQVVVAATYRKAQVGTVTLLVLAATFSTPAGLVYLPLHHEGYPADGTEVAKPARARPA